MNNQLDYIIEECSVHHDSRGALIQFISDESLNKSDLTFGQVYLITFDGTGVIRGNHYHNRSGEVFCVIQGSVEIRLENIDTKSRFQKIFEANENGFFKITIGPRIAHTLISISKNPIVISLSTERYKPSDEDKTPYILT